MKFEARSWMLPVALALATISPADARERVAFMPGGMTADAPLGFVEMCRRDAALCLAGLRRRAPAPDCAPAPRMTTVAWHSWTAQACGSPSFARAAPRAMMIAGAPAARAATRSVKRTAEYRLAWRVNAAVNRQVVQTTDMARTGIDGDLWERPAAGQGDCEDLAIEKRMRLVEAGFPADRLFYAVAYKRGFGLHTLLIAQLDDGDWVLDSLSPRLRHWSDVRYAWLRRQSTDNPMTWTRVDGSGARVAGVTGAPLLRS